PESGAVELPVVVPAGAVEHRSFEALEAVDVGVARVVQHARRRDHDIDLVAVSALSLEVPTTVDEPTARDLVAETDVVDDAVFLCHSLEVRLNLLAGREAVTPVGSRRERV